MQKPQGAAAMSPRAQPAAVYAGADPAMDPKTRDPGTHHSPNTNGEDTEERSTPSEAPAASSVPDSAPSSSAAAQPPVGRRRRRTVRPREEPSEVQRELLEALRNRPPPPPPPRVYSSMEHFLLGLAPSLERLSLEKQELIKLKLMRMIFEHSTVGLNLDHVDPE
ncbi:myosin-1-like [Girardinichthys multiradiatus]|uniref:myosin-1-like n=1 Tax=Girardinichthys multiradiatus TaxID=208333 RepID=UPI001FAC7725|nr:myosin-1-like [Girardinichthys multiradiatus]